MAYSCNIQLDNPRGAYRAGETINLTVFLTLTERALIKAISLESNGYATTAWQQPQKERKSKNQNTQSQNQLIDFENRVDYFAKIDYFLGSDAAQPQIIEAGTYKYGCVVKLPKNCPGNFEGTYGHIRYNLQVLIHSSGDRPVNVVHVSQLQIFPQNNLSQESRSCEENILEETPRFKFWMKPLHMKVQIPRQGYSPGSGISVHVKLHNPEKLQLRGVSYALIQISTYVGQQKKKPKRRASKVQRHTVLSSCHELFNLPRAELENFQHLYMLQVPQTAATLSIAECACIQLNYEVEVTVQTQNAKRFIVARIPVTIGNVTPPCPGKLLMQDPSHETGPGPVAPAESTLKTEQSFSASTASLVSDFREAEFMEATNLNKTTKHYLSGEHLDFRPRYVYYEMDQFK
ncbi:uncharacterized protein Dana_GF23085 [Drosophila ananassae]|uniref:Arrestin C-terminal-like domain-containing protein n=1 Tax=Drosophila ananassae TaxID=7217 RepID=B3MTN2_DROAN|nr:arrestin domain-containing protein 17 [Drosophila ananassae]EDV30163.1 uncharacterized protein Dana_GF23085 [Drosophila ananassae]